MEVQREALENVRRRLEASEQRYRVLFETMAQGVIYEDASGRIIDANPAACRILGLTLDQMRGRSSMDPRWRAIHEDGSPFPGEEHPASVALREGERVPDVVMGVFNPRTNDYAWIRVQAVPLVGEGDDRPHQVYATFEDITGRRRLETAYRAVVENSLQALVIVDADGVVFANRRAAEMTGYSGEELRSEGRSFFVRLIHPDDREMVLDRYERRLRGEDVPNHYEVRMVRKNGEAFWTELYATRIEYEGRPAVLATWLDISDRKEFEREFIQAQKMEAVGLLAGGLAHDFRNQLTVVKGYAQMLQRRELVTGKGASYVENIVDAVDQAAALSGQLLTFARRAPGQAEVVDVGRLLEEIGRSLPRLLGEDVRLRVDAPRGRACARLDPGGLQQAVMNLGTNARDAMPDGGDLHVEADRRDLSAGDVAAHGVEAGPYVIVRVADSGVGMSEETINRVFEPFFTTKSPGKGTGLGLAMVFAFVRQSGGFIELESTPEEGTCFTLGFPAVDQTPLADQDRKRLEELPAGAESLLAVEDDERIRAIVEDVLSGCGYDLTVCADYVHALDELHRRDGGPPAALITDVVMPGGSGSELAKLFRNHRPDGAVLFISGRGPDDDDGWEDDPRAEWLAKPFSPAQLADAVRRILDAPTGS